MPKIPARTEKAKIMDRMVLLQREITMMVMMTDDHRDLEVLAGVFLRNAMNIIEAIHGPTAIEEVFNATLRQRRAQGSGTGGEDKRGGVPGDDKPSEDAG